MTVSARKTAISRRCGRAKPSTRRTVPRLDPVVRRRCGRTAGGARPAAAGSMHPRHRVLLLVTWSAHQRRQLAEPADLASRSSRRCSSRLRSAAPCSSALVSRTAPASGAVRAATRSATVASSSSAGTAVSRQPDVHGLRGPDHPRGRADLQCPGVANALDQRLCSRQVGHQAERGLLHARTARRRRPPAGRRTAPAGSRRRWRSPAPPRSRRTAGRAGSEARWKSSIVAETSSSVSASRPTTDSSPAVLAGSSIARSSPAENAAPAPRTTTTRTSSGSSSPIAASAAPHRRRLRVAHLGPVQGDRRDGAVDVVGGRPAVGSSVFGSVMAGEIYGSTDGATRQASDTRSA